MFRLTLAFLLGLTAISAMAQDQSEKSFIAIQFCGPTNSLFDTAKKYQEQLLFVGIGSNFAAVDRVPYTSQMFMFANQDTGSWSLINVYPDGTACMAQSGQNFMPYTGPQLDDKS